MPNELTARMAITTLADLEAFAERISKSSFIPDTYKGKLGDIIACVQYGAEIGLSPMQALQGIAVINGRPSVWGDAMLALVQASGKLEWIEETETATAATCTVKRVGDPKVATCTWSQEDTVKAGLANKSTHATYPKRMRKWRARGFALRDKFADVLKGIISREEAMDMPTGSYKHVESTNEPIVRPGEVDDAQSEFERQAARKALKVVADEVNEVRDKSAPDLSVSNNQSAPSATLTQQEVLRLLSHCKRRGMTLGALLEYLATFGINDPAKLQQSDLAEVEAHIEAWEG